MAKLRGDTQTLDLLAWEPASIVEAFAPERVRTSNLRSKIARAVSECMKDFPGDREILADKMSDWLGEDVSFNMLNAYASEAREDQTIPYLRLLALTHVTGDVRLLQLGAELMGHSVIEDIRPHWGGERQGRLGGDLGGEGSGGLVLLGPGVALRVGAGGGGGLPAGSCDDARHAAAGGLVAGGPGGSAATTRGDSLAGQPTVGGVV